MKSQILSQFLEIHALAHQISPLIAQPVLKQIFVKVNYNVLRLTDCHEYCKTCSSSLSKTACTECAATEGLILTTNGCECQTSNGYYENESETSCLPCHKSCMTCDGPNEDNCITCNENEGYSQSEELCTQPPCEEGQYFHPDLNCQRKLFHS
jgi:hypothetical protein